MKQSHTLLIGLNEFNEPLIKDLAQRLDAQSILRALGLKRSETTTENTLESDLLEPWVQWVSLHTGVQAKSHGIKHLGDVPALKQPQIWEQLSATGRSSVVWGALNARRGNAPLCELFVPDPWVYGEDAFPESLNPILELPRYAAKNRSALNPLHLLARALSCLRSLLTPKVFLEFLWVLPRYAWAQLLNPGKEYPAFCMVEYLCGIRFLEEFKKRDADFGYLFVNSIAHIQHYYWPKPDSQTIPPAFRYTLPLIDRLFKKIFQTLGQNDSLLVINALSQIPTHSDVPWISYRPKDHFDFLTTLQVRVDQVEALMSYDATITMKSAEDLAHAIRVLSSGKMPNGIKILHLETYPDEPLKLFYRLNFTDELPEDALCTFSDREYSFFDLFEPLGKRTGKHSPFGCVYSDRIDIPARLQNHEVSQWVIRHVTRKINEA